MSRSLLLAFSLVFCIPFNLAQAEELPPRASTLQILVPVRIGDFPGVGNSLWKNELWIHNDNDVAARVFRLRFAPSACPPYCGGWEIAPIPEAPIPPHSTVKVPSISRSFLGEVGEFFYVDRALASRLFCELRTHDESRNGMSAGTGIPVIPETAGRHRIQLLSVPVSSSVRLTLRIYTFSTDFAAAPGNRIRYYDADSEELLGDDPILFYGSVQDGVNTYTLFPYPNEIHLNLTSDPRLVNSQAVRIELESSIHSFWAYLSATNNLSQEVTIISPSLLTASASN